MATVTFSTPSFHRTPHFLSFTPLTPLCSPASPLTSENNTPSTPNFRPPIIIQALYTLRPPSFIGLHSHFFDGFHHFRHFFNLIDLLCHWRMTYTKSLASTIYRNRFTPFSQFKSLQSDFDISTFHISRINNLIRISNFKLQTSNSPINPQSLFLRLYYTIQLVSLRDLHTIPDC